MKKIILINLVVSILVFIILIYFKSFFLLYKSNIQYYDLHNFLSNLNNDEISIQNDGHISKLVHEKISEVIDDFIVNNYNTERL